MVSAAWGYRPDGQPMLATGSFDSTARIWDPDTGELVHRVRGHGRTMSRTRFNQDASLLAACGSGVHVLPPSSVSSTRLGVPAM